MKASAEKLFDLSHVMSVLGLLLMMFVYAVGVESPWILGLALVFQGVAVITAVHHAEVIAVKVGPSLGALILAISVTIIEVGLIVSLMMNDTPESAVVARDTVFSAVIIVTNGIVGVCLLLGGLRYREQIFHVQGAGSLLSVLALLSGLTLVLPNYTLSTSGPTYNTGQLIFASVSALILYIALVFFQTKTHRDYFEPLSKAEEEKLEASHYMPSSRAAWLSFAGLALSLVAVIGFAKALSPAIEAGVSAVGAPRAMVGIVIALLVLLPETWAAVAAARNNQLQTSLNLALGSGAASIALTIPVVSVFSIMTSRDLVLGLDPKGMVFLLLTFIVGGLTLGTGRGTALHGVMHLVLLAAYLVLSFFP